MKVHGVTLYHTITEEEIGTVIKGNDNDNIITFEDEVRRTWELYHDKEDIYISDFAQFHNENSDVKVKYLDTEMICLI